MILMDCEGSKIQGTISKDVLASTCFYVTEGSFYKIGRVIVVKNDSVERVTDHPFKLFFWRKSVVKPWQPKNCHCFGIKPMTASQILHFRDNACHLIDVVGHLTSISTERQHILDDQVVKMILLELTDETGRVEYALYDEYVDQVQNLFKSFGKRCPVVIVQFARMMPFDDALFGDCFIDVVSSVTNLIVNHEIDQAFDFIDRLLKHGMELLRPLNHHTRERLDIYVFEDYLFNFPTTKIRQMCMEVEAGLYVLFGTIIDVAQNDEWWEYFVKHEGKVNHVSNASRFGPPYVLAPRYNIKVEVFDAFDSGCIALKDNDVEKLMKKSFKDLFHSLENPESSNMCNAFQCIIGKKVLFVIEKSSSNQVFTFPTFKARSVCDDPEIMRMFVTKHYFAMDSWNKLGLVSELKRFCPTYDYHLFCHHFVTPSSQNIQGVVGVDCSSGSSSMVISDRPIARNLNEDLEESVNVV